MSGAGALQGLQEDVVVGVHPVALIDSPKLKVSVGHKRHYLDLYRVAKLKGLDLEFEVLVYAVEGFIWAGLGLDVGKEKCDPCRIFQVLELSRISVTPELEQEWKGGGCRQVWGQLAACIELSV